MKRDPDWPRRLGDDAYHGLAGRVVNKILPETEADPANLLISFLVAFGNSIGRKAHVVVDATPHYANEFVVMVGPTAMARKGSGWNQIARLFEHAENMPKCKNMWTDRIKRGLSTGEGLIAQVAPAPSNHRGDPSTDVKIAPEDSRLLILEAEFARVLTVMNRPDNTLSTIIRSAWETGDLSVMTRKDPLDAKGAHISIIGQITTDELRKHLNATERANGFANRFMFIMVKRSKELPFGGQPIDYTEIAPQLMEAQITARKAGVMRWAPSFRAIWPRHYSQLTAERSGMFGALTTRGAPHVLRLAMIYALLDRSSQIREVHLRAAIAVWRYCESSTKYIFGAALGDDTADAILLELQKCKDGLTHTQIFRDVFSSNKSSSEIKRALSMLEREGLVEFKEAGRKGRGRPTKGVWYAISTLMRLIRACAEREGSARGFSTALPRVHAINVLTYLKLYRLSRRGSDSCRSD
jgi:hypothetical protein